MLHNMPLKNVSGQSYKVTIRTLGSSLVVVMQKGSLQTSIYEGMQQIPIAMQ